MDKTIENKFFKEFKHGIRKCFDWLTEKYDLGFRGSREAENSPKEELTGKWKNYYDVTLPQEIAKLVRGFDDSGLRYDSPLMEEIGSNIDSLSEKDRERYIFSLLKPFREYSDKMHPEEQVIKELKGEMSPVCGIGQLEEILNHWQSILNDEKQKDEHETATEQISACTKMIDDYKYRIERAEWIARRLDDIVQECLRNIPDDEKLKDEYKNSVEFCFAIFLDAANKFGTLLDCILLERGINLLWYQNEIGICLTERTMDDILAMEYYLGSYKLVMRYIDEALPKLDEPTKEVTEGEDAATPTETTTVENDVADGSKTTEASTATIPHTNKLHRKESKTFKRKKDNFMKMMDAFAGTDLAESKDNKWIWKSNPSLFGFACGILFCGDRVILRGFEKYEIAYGKGDMPTSDICMYVENPGSFAQQRQNKKSKAITTIPNEWKDIAEIFEKVGIKFFG